MSAYLPSLLGGVLIGVAVLGVWLLDGEVAGISGIVDRVLKPAHTRWAWAAWFIAGLLAGGMVMAQIAPTRFVTGLDRSPACLIVSGLLVGFGTRLAGGCTSGHGLCGVSRLAPRSLVATAVFMILGVVTVLAVRGLSGVG
jgi:uncharacterized membrane protein YedE/YeeE